MEIDNIQRLINSVSVNIRFNNKYGLQYYEPDAYNKICDILSLLRKNKEITGEDYHLIRHNQKHFYLNFFKIKKLEELEPRVIAQKFIGRKKIREYIFKRDGYRCLNCGSNERLQIDHINPISRGGENKISNLQTLCNSCNSKKRDNFKDYRNG